MRLIRGATRARQPARFIEQLYYGARIHEQAPLIATPFVGEWDTPSKTFGQQFGHATCSLSRIGRNTEE